MNNPVLAIREATLDNAPYCAEACVRIVRHMQRTDPRDVYIAALPTTVSPHTLEWVEGCIHSPQSIALLAAVDDVTAGCLMGTISETNMPATGLGEVGHISVCWVEPSYRQSGVASHLVKRAEQWFRQHSLSRVELSYMAGNALARNAWTQLGYAPFRTFAHKAL